MIFNKEKFLKSEIGAHMDEVITTWDSCISKMDLYKTNSSDYKANERVSAEMQTRWDVIRMMIRQLYGIKYYFTRNDDYFGVCTENEGDWLIKKYRKPFYERP
ncbi:MAG: hypothetical protein LKJ25_08670 [Clostridia bacterium]|jgi:hypothetical protein|nr:hypothetical protein [Clostridia bacterium]